MTVLLPAIGQKKLIFLLASAFIILASLLINKSSEDYQWKKDTCKCNDHSPELARSFLLCEQRLGTLLEERKTQHSSAASHDVITPKAQWHQQGPVLRQYAVTAVALPPVITDANGTGLYYTGSSEWNYL
jgi:hypothetical protein